ncbi:MAG: helix-turn-helix domain-containing protein [bacterium]|nr:helix-turn-helix domain-containing protein [bacterium]
MIQQLLEQLGFSEKEIAIYIAVLQKGKVSPSEVAKTTGINRTTIYSVAKDLIKRGVISEDLGIDPTRYLVALPLNDLKQEEEKKIENKKEILNQAIEELSILSKDARYTVPKIVFVDGKNLEKYLHKQNKTWSKSIMKRDGIWWGFQDHTLVEHYEKWIDSYWKGVPSPELSVKLLTNKSPIEQRMAKKQYPQRKMKFWSDTKQFTASTWVCGDYVVMIITNQKPHYLVEIYDATLAHNMRETFKGLWKMVR